MKRCTVLEASGTEWCAERVASVQALYMGRQWRRALALLRDAGLVEADVRGRYLAARCLMEVRVVHQCVRMLAKVQGAVCSAQRLVHSFHGECVAEEALRVCS